MMAMDLPPIFLPVSRNVPPQASAPAPQGALLNHLSCRIWALTSKEKLPISSRSRCLTSGMIGAVTLVP